MFHTHHLNMQKQISPIYLLSSLCPRWLSMLLRRSDFYLRVYIANETRSDEDRKELTEYLHHQLDKLESEAKRVSTVCAAIIPHYCEVLQLQKKTKKIDLLLIKAISKSVHSVCTSCIERLHISMFFYNPWNMMAMRVCKFVRHVLLHHIVNVLHCFRNARYICSSRSPCNLPSSLTPHLRHGLCIT